MPQQRQLKKSIERLLIALRRELKSLDADLDEPGPRLASRGAIKEDLLSSVPGIGKGIARTLIAETARAR